MWMQFREDKSKYSLLAEIKDDNNDGIPEVNSEKEIDVFIKSVSQHLTGKGYDLQGKKIVWVNNDLIYFSGKSYKTIPKEVYEASPYASVYKFSHDISPSGAAIGTNGCVDCHSFNSPFFFSEVIKYPFGEKAQSVTEPQFTRLGISGFFASMGAVRESILKPLLYSALALFFLLLVFYILYEYSGIKDLMFGQIPEIIYPGLIGLFLTGFAVLLFSDDLTAYLLPNRILLDGNHFLLSILVLLIGLVIYIRSLHNPHNHFIAILLILSCFSGVLMFIKFDFMESLVRFSYTLFDLSLLAIVLYSIVFIAKKQIIRFNKAE